MNSGRTPEELEHICYRHGSRHHEHTDENGEKYTPRPKGQIVWAWILVGVVVLGVVNITFWMMRG